MIITCPTTTRPNSNCNPCRPLFAVWKGAALFLLLLSLPARAQSTVDQKQWRILIEPKFMGPEISFPIPDATSTLFVPGWFDGDEIHYFTKKEFQDIGLTWDEFQEKARPNADEDLKTLTIRYERNKKKVIEYAEVKSGQPIAAASLLSTHFLDRFRDIFGIPLLVAVPSRFTLYLFPKLAGNSQDYAPMVIREYHDSTWPVSTELLEAGDHGIRAVGQYEEP